MTHTNIFRLVGLSIAMVILWGGTYLWWQLPEDVWYKMPLFITLYMIGCTGTVMAIVGDSK